MMKKLIVMMTVLGLAAASQAVLLDDFESYGLGKVKEASGGVWTGIFDGTGNAVVETDGSNQYGSWWAANNGARGMWRTLPTPIADADTATTVFMQVMTRTATNDGSFGLSDIAVPSTWGDFEVQGAIINGGLHARNAADPVNPVVNLGYAINTNQWYNIWFVINNSADTYDMYVTASGNATAADLVADDFVFRNSGAGTVGNDLITLMSLANTRADVQKFHWDNIAITSGVDLRVVPEPATLALLGLGSLLLRKRKA